ncbi:multifunctional CCA addition/repair protein [Pseudomaricurvus alkylphenolicus]|jgi:tRNA nucleotidyltransferase (CCA-adding enzyme)|uniref:multifunctional CCA addition/repair protein n=1 Tax=Pseudomaricurvus alkylphenolicus TaxID=1306991 RepID=UPI00141E30D7|nr:multifunctional CCA addition/repair protein [Pseudomaricurvus alkylphenolicus]NIB44273.1 multifunctional CCA addition/repair protein [Pseudomaricurvus alkylphenolicus]
MKEIYLVGGAVRDKLLGYPYSEKDWVVVGATPEEMESEGYRPVGKDFPVFLHPETGEEYALARTERKTAPGYSGFVFHTSPDITLKEDLLRRDLTINAIAEDCQGNIFDPYGGRQDLQSRILRHVSDAFSEDPVRVLRVARFAARYHHLGFTLAEETRQLMSSMVQEGEVSHLVPERVWKETERALREPSPHIFVEVLRQCGALAVIMPELDNLFGVPQPKQHHPEVDCGLHCLMALEQARQLSEDSEVLFAALVHDLGKAETPTEELPRHIGHESRSLPLIETLCDRLGVPKKHRELALSVARDHTNCHRAMELRPTTLMQLMQRLDGFRRPQHLEQFLLACEADAKGRTGLEQHPYPQREYVLQALVACNRIQARDVMEEGITGKAIGEALTRKRVSALKQFKQQFTTQDKTQ